MYLPYECDENRDDYIDCLEKLNMVVENIDSTHITLVGDYNANLSRSSVFGDILVKFCADNNLNIVEKDTLPDDLRKSTRKACYRIMIYQTDYLLVGIIL